MGGSAKQIVHRVMLCAGDASTSIDLIHTNLIDSWIEIDNHG